MFEIPRNLSSGTFRAEGALSIVAPENIVENTSVLKMKIPLWPSESLSDRLARPVASHWCIIGIARVIKKSLKKKFSWQFKFHRLDLVMKCLTHTFLNGRGGPRILTKIHCDFHQKSVSGASDVPCRFWDTSTGSVTTAGTPPAFGDGMMIDTSRHTLDSCDFVSFLNGSRANSLLQ